MIDNFVNYIIKFNDQKKITPFFLLFIIVACNNDKIDYSSVPNKIYPFKSTKIICENIIEETFVVPLETTNESQMNSIKDIKFSDNFIFVHDSGHQGIFVFAINSGKFLRHINLQGAGPGEYSRIDDFIINQKDKCIDVFDSTLKIVNRYDFEGNFITMTKIPFNGGREVTRISKEELVIMRGRGTRNDIPFELVTLKNNKLKNKFFKVKKSLDMVFTSRNNLFKSKDSIYYLPIYSPLLYKIENDLSIPQFYFDFENSWIDKKTIIKSKVDPSLFSEKVIKKNLVIFFNVTMGESYLAYDYIQSQERHVRLYDLNSKESYEIENYKKTIYDGIGFNFFNNGYFISLKEQPFIIKAIEENLLGTENISEEIKNNLNPYGNPVLIFTKFKDI